MPDAPTDQAGDASPGASAQSDPRLGFWHFAADHLDECAVVDPDGAESTFGDLLVLANQAAHGLRALGLERESVVAVMLPNHHTWLALYLATQQVGMYFTPINWHLTAAEVAHVVADSDAEAFVTHERFASVSRNVVAESGLAPERCFAVGAVEGFRPFDALVGGQPTTTPEHRSSGQVMAYTSGTTGRPKGVRRALGGGDPSVVAEQSTIFARAFDYTLGQGVHLVTGPLYHAGPFAFATAALHAGHTLVLMDKWDAQRTLELVERYRVTDTHVVATMFHRLLALPKGVRTAYDLSSLRVVAHSAAPTPVAVKHQMMDWLGPVIWETYGGTEGAATIAKPHRWLEKPGTVGRAVRGVTISIIDDDGNECPVGAPGTIYIETGVSVEYHKDPEATLQIFRGSMLTLGDVGYLDADGYLFLVDRKKDLIISGGVNISPAEVEATLLEHPAVGDVAVIGVPNEEWGEEVKAIVEPVEGVEGSPELADELIAFCRERLAHFKCPRTVDFRAELPRAESGKLYKRRLRDEYWSKAHRAI